MATKILERKPKLQERFTSFLSPSEQTRVRAKYEGRSFAELLADLQANVGDAILYIMDKYDPLLNAIYKKFKNYAKMKAKQYGDYPAGFDLQEWKNEVFLYLSGAGVTQPFYNLIASQLRGRDDETLWKYFTVTLHNSLRNYIRKLISQQMKGMPGGAIDIERAGVTAQASMAAYKPQTTIKTSLPTDNETLQILFEKYLMLLKLYSERYKRAGKTMYRAVALRVKGKTAYEIAEILGITPSGVWKSLGRAKKKWLKFLDAHKTTGETPEKLERKIHKNRLVNLLSEVWKNSAVSAGKTYDIFVNPSPREIKEVLKQNKEGEEDLRGIIDEAGNLYIHSSEFLHNWAIQTLEMQEAMQKRKFLLVKSEEGQIFKSYSGGGPPLPRLPADEIITMLEKCKKKNPRLFFKIEEFSFSL